MGIWFMQTTDRVWVLPWPHVPAGRCFIRDAENITHVKTSCLQNSGPSRNVSHKVIADLSEHRGKHSCKQLKTRVKNKELSLNQRQQGPFLPRRGRVGSPQAPSSVQVLPPHAAHPLTHQLPLAPCAGAEYEEHPRTMKMGILGGIPPGVEAEKNPKAEAAKPNYN